jgi:Flp pilus assembly protein TadD
VALAVSLTLPWLAERDLKEGRTLAAADPAAAVKRLDSAASLDPLSFLADETAAVILRQHGQLAASERRFREILARDPRNPFVNMQLALLASLGHRQEEAVRLIRRADELNPRDWVTRFVRRELEAGQVLAPSRVDRMITNDIESRTGRR